MILVIGMFLFLINTESSEGHKDEVASLHHKGFRSSPVCHIHYIKVIKCVTIVFIQNVCIDQHGPNSPDSRPTPLYYFQPPINVSYSMYLLFTFSSAGFPSYFIGRINSKNFVATSIPLVRLTDPKTTGP